jgi:hypothetical protein
MRNLHRDRIYFDTPWFIEILSDLKINVVPKRDERILRRFIMGEKMNPISYPQPISDLINSEIPCSFAFDECTPDNLAMLGPDKESIEVDLKSANISLSDVKSIELIADDSEFKYVVIHSVMQSESKLLRRREQASLFNEMILNTDKIYTAIDKKLAELKS